MPATQLIGGPVTVWSRDWVIDTVTPRIIRQLRDKVQPERMDANTDRWIGLNTYRLVAAYGMLEAQKLRNRLGSK